MALNPILANFSKTYTDQTYRHTATVRHKGSVIAFAMDSDRRIHYTVLNLSGNTGGDVTNAAPISPFDRDAWLNSPKELYFPNEITEVGFSVAGNTRLPVFRKNKTAPEAAGTALPTPDRGREAFDYFKSTTARLSALAPFQVLSDGQYVYLFRRALNSNDTSNVLKTNADGTSVKDRQGQAVRLVNATLLVDRFMLVDTELMPKMEVRFQRSRSKTRPANRKDSLGAKDLDGNPFFEPTQELRFVGPLHAEGRFSVLLLPTAIAGLQRWQIFAENSRTGRMDCFNVERSAEGLFNTRGTPDAAATQKGYAESALQFTDDDAHVTLANGPLLGSAFTIEAWLKPTLRQGDTEPLALISSHGFADASRNRPDAAPSIWIEGGTRLRVGFGDGSQTWLEHTSKSLLTLDAWNHIAVSFDGAKLRLYTNGRLRESTETAKSYFNGNLQTGPDAEPLPIRFSDRPLRTTSPRQRLNIIGNQQPASNPANPSLPPGLAHAFCGTLDEIRVWHRARSQSEISAERGYRLTGLEPDLAAYWHFDERDGNRALNAVGNDGLGTVQNCTRVASDAPVGEHPGLQRSTFSIPGRTFASGPASLLYFQQSEAASGYEGKKKPLKQSGRVMFAATTRFGSSDKKIAALDFAVSASGRLAQIPDAIDLPTLTVRATDNTALNDTLDAIAALQSRYSQLNEELARMAPATDPAKITQRDNVLAELNGKKALLNSGASAVMRSVVMDQLGLGVSGGLLDFAWSDAAPLLFDSATGSLAMYFKGTDNQFFVAYYDTRTERARYDLLSQSTRVLTCIAHSSDPGMDQIEIAVTDTAGDATTCQVVITGPGGLEETWKNVPRNPAEFAKVFNGLAEERSYIGAGSLSTDGSQLDLDPAGTGVRRAIPRGATIAVGDVRFVVQQAVGIGAKQILLQKTDPAQRTTTAKLPAFFIGYDYQANTTTTNLVADLYNGSLLLLAAAEPGSGTQLIDNQTVSRGTTLSCQWTADTPGTTLHFDGKDQVVQTTSMPRPAGNFTLETWARPSLVNNRARLLHHRTAGPVAGTASEYALGLVTPRMSALNFDGTNDHISMVNVAGVNPGKTAFTIEAWLRIDEYPTARSWPLVFGKGGVGAHHWLIKTDGATQIGVWGSELQQISPTIPLGQWVHIASVFDGTNLSLYINGEQFGSAIAADFNLQKTAASDTGLPLTLAQKVGGSGESNFKGQMDEVRIWKEARTQAQIKFGMLRRFEELITTNLVGYWHFEGGAATDHSINNSHGTITGTPHVTTSPLSPCPGLMSALKFDGTNDHISMANVTGVNPGKTAFTIEAWLRMDQNPAVRSWPLVFGKSANGAHHWLIKTDGMAQIGVWGSSVEQISPTIPLDQWVHIASVFDGTNLKVYINGVQSGSAIPANINLQKVAAGDAGLPLTLAKKGLSSESNFKGQMDEVRVWKRARTEQDIRNDMHRRLGGMETDLVGYWHFEDGVAKDYSRNRNNGTITGSPVVAASPLQVYGVFAVVNGQQRCSTQVWPVGNWNHLALTYAQAYGLSFNGSDNSLDCGNDDTLALNQDLSIEVFCHIRDLGRDQLILQKGNFDPLDTTQRVPYTLLLNSGNKLVFAFENVDGKAVSCVTVGGLSAGFHKITVTRSRQRSTDESQKAQGIVKTTEWFEMLMVVDGNRMNAQLYVDGQKKGAADTVLKYETTQPASDNSRKPVDIGSSNGKMVVGKALTVPGKAFKGNKSNDSSMFNVKAFSGTISEIRIWNTDRSRSPQADGSTATPDSRLIGQPLNGSEKGLVSWWRFHEGSGNRAFDSKGQNHALISGATWVNSPDPDGSKLTLFVNGQAQATAPFKAPVLSETGLTQFSIGALKVAVVGTSEPLVERFQGEMEEMRLWKVTRTEEQIQDNLFRSLVERRTVGSQTQEFVEGQEDLLAYYTFDADPLNPGRLGDHSLLGNHLTLARSGAFLVSTAPVSSDTPLVRSALAGMKNNFNGLIAATPGVQEYADMQMDSAGNLIGVFKRCYSIIAYGQWTLLTGHKVGDMAVEWIGQVQFAPELIGFIEGAPPVPSENLTTKSVDNIGDLDDYNESSFVELVEAEETTYTYSASRDKGFDMSVEANLGAYMVGVKMAAGVGVEKEVAKVEIAVGLKTEFEHSLGWLQDGSTSVGRATAKTTSMELRGRFSTPEEAKNEQFGRRFIPDNMGQALVKSETADVFALRLLRNGALISFQMRPNPDIPKDWNIISFPINPAYTKQGTLDGKIGLQPDVDYPNALTYSPDSSYFKPIEAYALKNRINRAETELKTYYEQYTADTLGRRQAATHFTEGDLAVGKIVEKLPQLYKRNIVNTYVWTADGGLFAETLQTMDSRSESTGGSYALIGMLGFYFEGQANFNGVGPKWGLDALFGGHLNLTVTKSTESKSSFGLNVSLDKVERDIYLRETDDEGVDNMVFDTSDTKRPKPVRAPGKVDAYRFMSFYLEPNTDHYDLFFSKIVDPVWLEQSDDPAAVALRGARQPKTKPACWRVMHRVTYVSRVLPPLDLSAPASLEKTLQTLDVDSNYELIKLLEPYVADKISNFSDFSTAVDVTLARLLPELVPHKQEVKQYLSAYFGLAAEETDTFGQGGLPERAPNQPPIVNAGADQTVGLDGASVTADMDASVIDDRLERAEDIFVTWEKAAGPDVPVGFANPNAPKTTATFSKRGRYDLRLTASDGSLQASDSLTVIVNERPVISAGVKQEVAAAKDASGNPVFKTKLAGTITDTGLGDPATGTLTAKWSKKSGLGAVVFTDESKLDTEVRFPARGHYLLQLSVDNGTFTTTSEVLVAVAARATRDLQALYTFEETTGQTVRNVSGTGTDLDLQIDDATKVTRRDGFLKFDTATSLSTDTAATQLSNALKAADQISLEVWLKPTDANVQGLNRILTLSGGATLRNFTLGQNGNNFQFHLRADSNDLNASNKVLAGGTAVAGQLTQLVVTRDASGFARMYINGVEVANRMVAGSFAGWDDTFKLSLGNEIGGGPGRAWLGELHLIAVYSRALTISEIQQNFDFGADTNLPPVVSAGEDQVVNWGDFNWAMPSSQKLAIALNGRVTHDRDELGNVNWEQVGGPTAGVRIVDEHAVETSVEITQKGRYIFRLTVDDGVLTMSDETAIIVNCQPNVLITSGAQKLAGPNVEADLIADLLDSGLAGEPAGNSPNVTFRWSKTSGPALTIDDTNALSTKASFNAAGNYEFKFEARNGLTDSGSNPLMASETFRIAINKTPALSVANVSRVVLSNSNSLTIDDITVVPGTGNPADQLNIIWELISGPVGGAVTDLENFQTPNITAVFTKRGLYILRMTATNPDNPELTASIDIRVAVNSKPVIDISPVPDPVPMTKTTSQPYMASLDLDATVSDDGLPENPGRVTLTWIKSGTTSQNSQMDFFVGGSKVNGNATTDVVQVRFKLAGTYVLKLQAFDGAETTETELSVTV